MVTQESTQVIDPEFGFYGPMGFDVGAYLGNLILAYFSQDGHADGENDRKVCLTIHLVHKFSFLAINRFTVYFLIFVSLEQYH